MIRNEVYRIGREALLNAFRHSEASQVEITLEYAAKRLRISVRDNGKGISPALFCSGCSHKGLSGIQQLAERMGAKLTLLSRVALGTEVVLSIPGQVAYESQAGVRHWGYFSKRNA
jgi:signal transduction histidine kinase